MKNNHKSTPIIWMCAQKCTQRPIIIPVYHYMPQKHVLLCTEWQLANNVQSPSGFMWCKLMKHKLVFPLLFAHSCDTLIRLSYALQFFSLKFTTHFVTALTDIGGNIIQRMTIDCFCTFNRFLNLHVTAFCTYVYKKYNCYYVKLIFYYQFPIFR